MASTMSVMQRFKLESSVQQLVANKYSSGEISSLEKLGIYGSSVEQLRIDRFDDKILLQLNQELRKSPTDAPPNPYLRTAVLRSRFSKTVSNATGGGCEPESSAVEQRSGKRRNWEEKKKELEKIEEEREERRIKLKRQRAADEMRAEVTKKVKEVEDNAKVALKDLCWPEDNFRVMMEFELLINGGAIADRRHLKSGAVGKKLLVNSSYSEC